MYIKRGGEFKACVVWFGRAGQEEKQQLEAIVKGTSRIIGSELPSTESIYHTSLHA